MTWTTGTQGVRGVDRGLMLPEDEGTQEARGADVSRDTGFWWRGGVPGGARGGAGREGGVSAAWLLGCGLVPAVETGGPFL